MNHATGNPAIDDTLYIHMMSVAKMSHFHGKNKKYGTVPKKYLTGAAGYEHMATGNNA